MLFGRHGPARHLVGRSGQNARLKSPDRGRPPGGRTGFRDPFFLQGVCAHGVETCSSRGEGGAPAVITVNRPPAQRISVDRLVRDLTRRQPRWVERATTRVRRGHHPPGGGDRILLRRRTTSLGLLRRGRRDSSSGFGNSVRANDRNGSRQPHSRRSHGNALGGWADERFADGLTLPASSKSRGGKEQRPSHLGITPRPSVASQRLARAHRPHQGPSSVLTSGTTRFRHTECWRFRASPQAHKEERRSSTNANALRRGRSPQRPRSPPASSSRRSTKGSRRRSTRAHRTIEGFRAFP